MHNSFCSQNLACQVAHGCTHSHSFHLQLHHRLRKAVRFAIHNSRTVEHSTNRELNSTMMNKLGTSNALKADLESQLSRVLEEQTRAVSQRASLTNALEAKR